MMFSRCALVLAALLALVPGRVAHAEAGSPVIAAAADLTFAVEEITARFKDETGMQVRLSLGSTGNFARQIR